MFFFFLHPLFLIFLAAEGHNSFFFPPPPPNSERTFGPVPLFAPPTLSPITGGLFPRPLFSSGFIERFPGKRGGSPSNFWLKRNRSNDHTLSSGWGGAHTPGGVRAQTSSCIFFMVSLSPPTPYGWFFLIVYLSHPGPLLAPFCVLVMLFLCVGKGTIFWFSFPVRCFWGHRRTQIFPQRLLL